MREKKPCTFIYKDENGQEKETVPDVVCCKRCSACPWNPEEQARRLKEGRIVDNAVVVIRHYSGDDEKSHFTKVAYGGLRQLLFPRKQKKQAEKAD